MIRTATATALLSLGAAVFAPPSSASDLVTLTHQGTERTTLVHRPSTAPPGPLPLVIALHGLGGTGAQLRFAGFDAVADRDGFAVAYPDAVAKAWSYGRPVNQPMPTVGGETVDDTGFIRRLIDHLIEKTIADPARIYVTGPSRGGLMAFTIACALADKIAAAAPLITGMTDLQRDDCRPARPVPVMVIAGTADRTQPFNGTSLPQGQLLSVPDTMTFWRELHGCGRPDAKSLPQIHPDDPTRVVLLEWSQCKSGGALRLYRVINGGHQLPQTKSLANPMSEERFGLRNRDIETADEVWSFFKSFKR